MFHQNKSHKGNQKFQKYMIGVPFLLGTVLLFTIFLYLTSPLTCLLPTSSNEYGYGVNFSSNEKTRSIINYVF